MPEGERHPIIRRRLNSECSIGKWEFIAKEQVQGWGVWSVDGKLLRENIRVMGILAKLT